MKEAVFGQAVQLAAAFVANGDIRLGQDHGNSTAHDELIDLIADLYQDLLDAQARLVERELTEASK